LLKILKPKSEFSKNVLTLMTGTSIAQAIPIAISPILTRIYSPEDFGLYALYMSLVSIIAVIATGRYEVAIMLPKKDEDAINIVFLSIIIAFLVSLIILLIVLVFNTQITKLLGNPEISYWLYLIPISVLLTGTYQSLNYWYNRKKKYKRLATSRVIQSSTTATMNLSMGVGGFGNSGLILGGVLGQGMATFILGRLTWKENYSILISFSKLKIFALLKKYIEFPIVNLPHAFLNNISSNLPILLLSYFFNNKIVGFYSLSNKIITIPMGIITNSFGQVFFQRMLMQDVSYIDRKIFFKKSMIKLLSLSFFPAFLIFIFAQDIFSFIFGDAWKIAGYYTQILIPMLYLRFTGSIVSSVVIIFDQQRKAFVIEIISTILRIFSLVIGGVYGDVVIGLVLYSLTSSIITLYRLYWYYQIVKRSK